VSHLSYNLTLGLHSVPLCRYMVLVSNDGLICTLIFSLWTVPFIVALLPLFDDKWLATTAEESVSWPFWYTWTVTATVLIMSSLAVSLSMCARGKRKWRRRPSSSETPRAARANTGADASPLLRSSARVKRSLVVVQQDQLSAASISSSTTLAPSPGVTFPTVLAALLFAPSLLACAGVVHLSTSWSWLAAMISCALSPILLLMRDEVISGLALESLKLLWFSDARQGGGREAHGDQAATVASI